MLDDGRGSWRSSISRLGTLGLALALVAACRKADPPISSPSSPASSPSPSSSPLAATGPEVWLEPVRFHGPSVWFPDELALVDDAIADVLARDHRYRVVDNRALHALRADAQRGRVPGSTTACAAPSIPAMVTQLAYPTAARGEVSLHCAPERCQLEVVLRAPGEGVQLGAEVRASFAATLPAGDSPEAWAAAVRHEGLQPTAHEDETTGGIMADLVGDLGVHTPGPHVSIAEVTQTGTWSSPLVRAGWSRYAAPLEACTHGQARRDWWGQPFVVEVDATGVVTRCESAHADRLPEPGRDCQCDVMRTMDLGRGSAGRRARFYLRAYSVPTRREPGHRRASLSRAAADDPTAAIGTGAVDSDALAACLAPIRAALDQSVAVTFAVGADGRVTRATASWPAAVPPPVAACLDRALAAGQFTCPRTGAATVTGVVDLYVEP